MKKLLNPKERAIFLALVIGLGLMGTTAGGGLGFMGLGLVIWVIWRGRKL